MKMALSEFVLREKGIYGILHVIILILSLFLVISISVDTFKGIPFYEQSVYMKVQLWICALFLADFVLEWFLQRLLPKSITTHSQAVPVSLLLLYTASSPLSTTMLSPDAKALLKYIVKTATRL